MIEYSDGRWKLEQLTDEELGNYERSQRTQDILEDDHMSILEDLRRQKDLDDRERELHRQEYGPWTPEEQEAKAKTKADNEKQREQIEANNRDFLYIWLWNQNSPQNAQVNENNQQCHEFIDTIKSITKELPRPAGPSDLEVVAAAFKALTPLYKPVIPPFDALRKAQIEMEEDRKNERAEVITVAKTIIDIRNEKRRLRREESAKNLARLKEDFPYYF